MKSGFKTIKPLGGPRDRRHGTIGGYAYWGCRCDKCSAANLEAGRRNRAEKMANLRPEDHGKAYTYNAGCRCPECKQAGYLAKAHNRRKVVKGPVVELSSLA